METQRAHGVVGVAIRYGLVQGILSTLIFLGQTLTGLKQNWLVNLINIAVIVVLMVLAHGEIKKTAAA